MKNKIIYGLLAFLIVCLLPTGFVSAENTEKTEKENNTAVSAENTTAANLQTLIEQLQNQIKELQEQLTKLKSEVQEVKEELKLTKNLYKGLSDEEVKKLQEFLKQYSEIYPEGLVTGFYGPLTEKAVKKFQEEHDIPATGLVGPLTRDKIKELSSEKKVIICHYPPENPRNKLSLEIGESALQAHLAHGDAIGACPPESVPTVPTPTTPVPTTPSPPTPTPSTPQPQFSLQVSLAVGPHGSNFVPGDTNARVVKIAFNATSDDVVINKLIIGKKGGSAGCHLQNFKLYNYTGPIPVQVGTAVSPDSDCRVVFDNLNLALSKERRLALELWVDFSSSAPINDTFSLGVIGAECALNTCPLGIIGIPVYGYPITIVRLVLPTITLLSPLGGEILMTGQPHTFKWETVNLPSNAKIDIVFHLYVNYGTDLSYSPPELQGLSDDGSETWITQANFIPGEYKARVSARYETSGYYHTVSDHSELISIGTGKPVAEPATKATPVVPQ